MIDVSNLQELYKYFMLTFKCMNQLLNKHPLINIHTHIVMVKVIWFLYIGGNGACVREQLLSIIFLGNTQKESMKNQIKNHKFQNL